MDIVQSTLAYERWLQLQLGDELVHDDLRRKHKIMASGPFAFLRATYWRWAETILSTCPGLRRAPAVIAVGDVHIENFGTWRDSEGRLVWGVNDFDEAAQMPYALDLVRLAASAILADVKGLSTATICASLLKGYRDGLEQPEAVVLDRGDLWLRKIFVVTRKRRAKFWRQFDPVANADKVKKTAEKVAKRTGNKVTLPVVPARHAQALSAARPRESSRLTLWPRSAGAGSLGRPRWVGYGYSRTAPFIRESKAIVQSAWAYVHRRSDRRLYCQQIATGKYRSPDPWYKLHGTVLVRRLSPNNRKLDLGEVRKPSRLIKPEVLWAMGRDLAAIHHGIVDRRDAILRDLRRRRSGWLLVAAAAAANMVRNDHRVWKAHMQREKGKGKPTKRSPR